MAHLQDITGGLPPSQEALRQISLQSMFPMEATISLSPPRPARSKFVFRIVIAVLILLLLAFLAFDFWFYRAVRSAMPQVDGTVSLAGLTRR